MSVVWKTRLTTAEVQDVELPAGARLLDVQLQRDWPCLWALVDPTQPLTPRRIYLTGTGHERSDIGHAEHVATFQWRGGLVFHIFDGGEKELNRL